MNDGAAARRREAATLLLQARHDGALGDADAARADALCASDPALRREAEGWAAQDAALRALFDRAEARIAAADVRRPRRSLRADRRRALSFGLGGCAALAAGMALLTIAPTPTPAARPGWRARAGAYVSLFDAETLTRPTLPPAALATGLRAASAALGRDLTALARPPGGLTLRRAEVLRLDATPLALAGYLDGAGQVVALCAVARPGAADAAPRWTPADGLGGVTWRSGGVAFVLFGPARRRRLTRLAAAFSAML